MKSARRAPLFGVALAVILGSGCGSLAGLHGARRPALAASEGWQEVPGVALTLQRSRTDCGAAALSSVLAYWRPEVTEDEVRGWVGPADDEVGVRAGRLRQVARDRGLEAFIIEGQFADLEREVGKRRPVIAGVVNVVGGTVFPHYEVVVGINPRGRRVLTADPAMGWREQSWGDFEERWKMSGRLLLVVLPPEGSPRQAETRSPAARPRG